MILLNGVNIMFCDSENLSIKLMSVIRMSWKGGFFRVAPRKQSAFIYRVSGRGVFTVDGKEAGQVSLKSKNSVERINFGVMLLRFLKVLSKSL